MALISMIMLLVKSLIDIKEMIKYNKLIMIRLASILTIMKRKEKKKNMLPHAYVVSCSAIESLVSINWYMIV